MGMLDELSDIVSWIPRTAMKGSLVLLIATMMLYSLLSNSGNKGSNPNVESGKKKAEKIENIIKTNAISMQDSTAGANYVKEDVLGEKVSSEYVESHPDEIIKRIYKEAENGEGVVNNGKLTKILMNIFKRKGFHVTLDSTKNISLNYGILDMADETQAYSMFYFFIREDKKNCGMVFPEEIASYLNRHHDRKELAERVLQKTGGRDGIIDKNEWMDLVNGFMYLGKIDSTKSFSFGYHPFLGGDGEFILKNGDLDIVIPKDDVVRCLKEEF